MNKKILSMVLLILLVICSGKVYASNYEEKDTGVTIVVSYDEQDRSEVFKSLSQIEISDALDSISTNALYLYLEEGVQNKGDIIKHLSGMDLGNNGESIKVYLGNKISIDIVNYKVPTDVKEISILPSQDLTQEDILRVDPDNRIIGSKYHVIKGSLPGMKPYSGEFRTIVKGSSTTINSISTRKVSGGDNMHAFGERKSSKKGRVTFLYNAFPVSYCYITLNSSGTVSFSD